MRTRIFLGIVLGLVMQSISALAQAGAESALTGAGSGVSTATTSSRFGNTLNQKVGQLSDRVGEQFKRSPREGQQPKPQSSSAQTSTPKQTPAPQAVPTDATGTPGAPMIASIEGDVKCSPANGTKCQAAASKTKTDDTYKSVINLGAK